MQSGSQRPGRRRDVACVAQQRNAVHSQQRRPPFTMTSGGVERVEAIVGKSCKLAGADRAGAAGGSRIRRVGEGLRGESPAPQNLVAPAISSLTPTLLFGTRRQYPRSPPPLTRASVVISLFSSSSSSSFLLRSSSPPPTMATTVVCGAQWGDEGKGKLVDILCSEATLCCRAQGGNNAGHTIVANGVTYDFHILPSGLVNPKCVNLVGSGCVVHVPSFFKELDALEKHGLDTSERIFISDRAHVVFDLHQMVDGLEEVELGSGLIGTTKKGIGPTYSTKMTRSGVRICDIFDHEQLAAKLRRLADGYKKRFGDLLKYDVEDEIVRYKVSHNRCKGLTAR